MIAVLRMLNRGRSRAERVRARLVAAGAAVATFLVCTAVSLADYKDEGGSLTGLGLALLALPVAGLVHQANRLASATRERRLAALRLAGAAPGDVRLLGALEGGLLALGGSLGGAALYVVTHLAGPLPQVPVVVVLVTLGGVVSGARAGRHVVASPLGVARRARVREPRVRDLILVLAGVGLFVLGGVVKGGFPLVGKYGSAVSMAAGLVLLLFGVTLAATWLIRAYARRAGRRARSPEALLAARLVEEDPRAWARALSVVFFGAGAGAQQAGVGYSQAHALVDVALLIALQWLGWAVARAVAMAGVGVLAAVLVALAARPLLRGALRLSPHT